MGFAEWGILPQSPANPEPQPDQTTKKREGTGSHLQKQDPAFLPTDQATTQPEDPQQYETSPWTYRPDECHEHVSAAHCEAKAVANSVVSEIAGVVE